MQINDTSNKIKVINKNNFLLSLLLILIINPQLAKILNIVHRYL